MSNYKVKGVFTGDAKGLVGAVNKSERGVDKLAKTKERLAKAAKKIAGGIGVAVKRVAQLGAVAAGAAVAGLSALTAKGLQNVDMLKKTADKIGVTTEALAGLQLAAEQTGVANTTLDKALIRLGKSVGDAKYGLTTAKYAFEQLGLSWQELEKLAPDEQFKKVAEAMKGVEHQSDRLKIAQDLLGGKGVALLNTMKLGAAGLEDYQKKAEVLGLTVSGPAAAGVESFNDSLDLVKKTVKGAANQLAVSLAPALQLVTDWFYKMLESAGGIKGVFEIATTALRNFVNSPLFKNIVDLVVIVIDTVKIVFTNVVNVFKNIIGSFSSSTEKTGGSIRKFLHGIVSFINDWIMPIFTLIRDVVNKVAHAIVEILSVAFGGLIDSVAGIRKAFNSVRAWILETFGGLIKWLGRRWADLQALLGRNEAAEKWRHLMSDEVFDKAVGQNIEALKKSNEEIEQGRLKLQALRTDVTDFLHNVADIPKHIVNGIEETFASLETNLEEGGEMTGVILEGVGDSLDRMANIQSDVTGKTKSLKELVDAPLSSENWLAKSALKFYEMKKDQDEVARKSAWVKSVLDAPLTSGNWLTKSVLRFYEMKKDQDEIARKSAYVKSVLDAPLTAGNWLTKAILRFSEYNTSLDENVKRVGWLEKAWKGLISKLQRGWQVFKQQWKDIVTTNVGDITTAILERDSEKIKQTVKKTFGDLGAAAGKAFGSQFGPIVGAVMESVGRFVGDKVGKFAVKLAKKFDDLFFSGKDRVTVGVNVTDSLHSALSAGGTVTSASGLRLTPQSRGAGDEGRRMANELLKQLLEVDKRLLAMFKSIGVNVDFSNTELRPDHPVTKLRPSDTHNPFGSVEYDKVSAKDIEQAAVDFVKAWVTEILPDLTGDLQANLLEAMKNAGDIDDILAAIQSAIDIQKEAIQAEINEAVRPLLEQRGKIAQDIALKTTEKIALENYMKEIKDAQFALGGLTIGLEAFRTSIGKVEIDTRTSLDVFGEIIDETKRLADVPLNTTDSIKSLSDALVTTAQAADALVLKFKNLQIQTDTQFDKTKQNIEEAFLSERELTDLRRTQLDNLVEQLKQTEDPETIQNLTTQINALINTVFQAESKILKGKFGDDVEGLAEAQDKLQQQFLDYIEDVRKISTEQIEKGLEHVLQKQRDTADYVETKIKDASDFLVDQFEESTLKLGEVKDELAQLADKYRDINKQIEDAGGEFVAASEAIKDASDSFGRSVELFGTHVIPETLVPLDTLDGGGEVNS